MPRYPKAVIVSAVAALLFFLTAFPSLAAGPEPGLKSPLKSAPPARALPAPPPAGDAPAVAPAPAPQAAPQPPPSSSAGPAWPQRFELEAGERTGFGFVVGSPGTIEVTVNWTGAPLVARLVKPDGRAVEKQGQGAVTLRYTATAADVQRGMLWSAGVRLAQEPERPAGPSGAQVVTSPVKKERKPLAQGTVSVLHPPGDPKAAEAELKALEAKAKAREAQAKQAAPPAADTVLAQRQAAYRKEQSARQARMLDQLQPKLPAEAYRQMSQRIATRANPVGGDAQKAAPGFPGAGVAPLSQPAAAAPAAPAPVKGARTAVEPKALQAVSPPETAQARSANVGVAGSTPPATVSADPAIASLSVSSGQPGDPVLITGTGFSGTPGEVHFIVANGKDLAAPVTIWNDTQIFTEVPDISGVMGYNGQLYVRRGNATSKLAPFRFNPAMEVRTLGISDDRVLRGPTDNDPRSSFTYGLSRGEIYYFYNTIFAGGKGDDEFYRQTRLKNGWIVDSAYIPPVSVTGCGLWDKGDAYVSEFRPGTDSPYLKVHWWADSCSAITYSPRVAIKGPKGVPHF